MKKEVLRNLFFVEVKTPVKVKAKEVEECEVGSFIQIN